MSDRQTATNIVMVGVGGQGSLTASEIVARAATLAGYTVATTEVHGMAQRGGSVFSSVRFGNVYSPVVPRGEAHYLIGFEQLEAVRYLPYLEPNGVALVNEQQIVPTIESLKWAPYPKEIHTLLEGYGREAIVIPGLAMAEELGNPKLTSAVILGAFSTFFDIEEAQWHQAIGEIVPAKTIDLNHRAFDAGADFVERHRAAAAG